MPRKRSWRKNANCEITNYAHDGTPPTCRREHDSTNHSTNHSTSNLSVDGKKGVHRRPRKPPSVVGPSLEQGDFKGRILSKRVVEKEVKVPKLVRIEEHYETLRTYNEVVLREEIVQTPHKVKERIVNVLRPIVKEVLVECPELQEEVLQAAAGGSLEAADDHRATPRPAAEHVVERVIGERAATATAQQALRSVKKVPVPIECVTEVEFELPWLEPEYTDIDVPVFVPRFIEVPCPVDAMDTETIAAANAYAERLMRTLQTAVSLEEVQRLAEGVPSMVHIPRAGDIWHP